MTTVLQEVEDATLAAQLQEEEKRQEEEEKDDRKLAEILTKEEEEQRERQLAQKIKKEQEQRDRQLAEKLRKEEEEERDRQLAEKLRKEEVEERERELAEKFRKEEEEQRDRKLAEKIRKEEEEERDRQLAEKIRKEEEEKRKRQLEEKLREEEVQRDRQLAEKIIKEEEEQRDRDRQLAEKLRKEELRKGSKKWKVKNYLIVLVIAVIAYFVYMHEGRLNDLEKGVTDLEIRANDSNRKMTIKFEEIDRLMKECGTERVELKKRLDEIDKKLFFDEHGKRTDGCYVAETTIQIDINGNSLPVWKIVNGSHVYNPVLGRTVRVKRSVAGPEKGYIWVIVTNDRKTVQVTETHPMKVTTNKKDWQNKPAKEIVIGDWTLTNSGIQQVISVEKRYFESVMVYNFELDMDSSLDTDRTVVANGIHTLDLYVQCKGTNKSLIF